MSRGRRGLEPGWRGTLHAWEERFWTWMQGPCGRVGAFVGIAFDLRRVAGPLDVEPALFGVIRAAAEALHPAARAARRGDASSGGSPEGRDRGPHPRRVAALDVKEAGIEAITSLARALAVEAGVPETQRGPSAGSGSPGM